MRRVSAVQPIAVEGTVSTLKGLTVLAEDLPVPVGSLVAIAPASGGRLPAEAVGFDGRRTILMMLGSSTGVRAGDRVVSVEASPTIGVGWSMLGRVVNGLGAPIDGGGTPRELEMRALHPPPLGPMDRRRITEPIETGVRAIDLMATAGRGQRLGIFAGPGVGKSTLMGMIARRTSASVNVIALVGERGREVKDFIEHSLGPEGLKRSVVIVATSDESPVMRVRAAFAACTAAEFFRDEGRDVMLMIDSVTRFAHAQRQIGLAVGEPPATKGYTPSVFAMLPTLLERAGAVEGPGGGPGGSVTGFYTVLVEGDDMTEPVSDAVRGILDGHIVLSRALAHRGHYPAIDVLDSVSRVANEVSSREHAESRRKLVRLLASYKEVEELIQIGAYSAGSNPVTDAAIALKPRIDALLQQGAEDAEPFGHARERLVKLTREGDAMASRPAGAQAGGGAGPMPGQPRRR
ncbi:MAG: FliI/YscN family ATPase [Phycisphaerales bacterium]|nr:FliI/YscN family ATPase [Phycisphaerales bacterium]